MAGTNAVIGALRVSLGIDSAQFNKGLSSSERRAEAFGRSMGRTLRNIGALALAVAGPAAIGALVKSSMAAIDANAKLATRLGTSVASIQALKHAADLAGVPMEAISQNLGILNSRLGEVERTGAGPAKAALDRLGISAQALARMPIDDRIVAISARMADLGWTTQQQADFLRQMGIRSQEMINLFQEGGAAIGNAKRDLEAWGVALSDVDASKVEAANDALSRIGTVFEGIGNQLTIRLAPYIEAAAQAFTDAAKDAGGFGDAMDVAMAQAARSVGALLDWLHKTRLALASIAMGATLVQLKTAEMIPWRQGEVAGLTEELHELAREVIALGRSELPSVELDNWLAKAKEVARVREMFEVGFGSSRRGAAAADDDTGETEAAKRAAEAQAAQLAARLETLRMSLLTERETELQAYAQRAIDMEDFHRRGMVSTDEYHSMVQAAERDHQATLAGLAKGEADLRQREMDAMLASVSGTLGAIGSIFQSESDNQFGIAKVAAIAQATISTLQGMAAGIKLGWPAGIPAVAWAAAQGAATIAALRSTTKTGGGAAPSTTPAPTAAAAAPTQAIALSLHGDRFGRDQVRELIESINDAGRDGAKLTIKVVTA